MWIKHSTIKTLIQMGNEHQEKTVWLSFENDTSSDQK